MIMDLLHPRQPLLFQVEEDLGERFNRAAEYPKSWKLVENLRAIGNKSCRKALLGLKDRFVRNDSLSEQDDLNTLGQKGSAGQGGLGVCDDGIDLAEITEE